MDQDIAMANRLVEKLETVYEFIELYIEIYFWYFLFLWGMPRIKDTCLLVQWLSQK